MRRGGLADAEGQQRRDGHVGVEGVTCVDEGACGAGGQLCETCCCLLCCYEGACCVYGQVPREVAQGEGEGVFGIVGSRCCGCCGGSGLVS